MPSHPSEAADPLHGASQTSDFGPYESGRSAVISAPPLVLTDDSPRRPLSIDVAAVVMIATTIVGVVIAATTFGALHHFNSTYPEAVAPVGAANAFVGQVETVVRVGLALVAVTALVLSITQAGLTSGVVRGNRGARLGAWALAALGVAAAVTTLLTMVLAHSTAPIDSSAPTASAVVQAAQQSMPGWFPGVVGILALLQALGFVAAAILLAAPSAASFFVRIMRPWNPSAAARIDARET